MSQFDPKLRRETRLLQEFDKDNGGRPIYRQLPYMFVEYDGDPDRYIEPVSIARYGPTDNLASAAVDGIGRIGGFEIITKRPLEVFAYDDFDAANS